MKILVTGSSGYYSQILCNFLSKNGYLCYGIDLLEGERCNLIGYTKLDILDKSSLRKIFEKNQFSAVIHLASQIDFAVKKQSDLYFNNLQSTKNILALSKEFGIKKIIFTSSNSIYLGNDQEIIGELDIPVPIDEYGRSKIDCENILNECKGELDINIIRCPNIIDSGRVGMLSILFELLKSNSTLWVLKGGEVRHQTIYAEDLNKAILKLLQYSGSTVHNIGCDEVKNFKEIFSYLIELSKSNSKIRRVPDFIVIPLLKLAYKFNLSPLGPYQFRMLTRDFRFDTQKIKRDLNWCPEKNNAEILGIAYDFFLKNEINIKNKKSANRGSVNLGILKILKIIKF